MNSIIDALPEDIEKSLYVDDLAVYCQSSNMAIIERRLQGCLDKLVTCADENGFKFSPTKTLCVHYCKKNGLQPEPNLKLYGQQLPVEEQVKFLGLFFDKKLSFITHIKYMKDKCRKALQLQLYPARIGVVTGQAYWGFTGLTSDPNWIMVVLFMGQRNDRT